MERRKEDLKRVCGLFGKKARSGSDFWVGNLRAQDVAEIQQFLDQHPDGCEAIMFRGKKEGGPALNFYLKPPFQKAEPEPEADDPF